MHEGYLALLIPIFGIVIGLGFPLATLVIFLILEHRKRRRLMELHHTERMAAIERGMDVPPLPLDLLRGRLRRRRSGLLPGLLGAFAGIAFLAVGGTLDLEGLLIAGAILLAIGAAFLVYYAIEGRKNVLADGENNRELPTLNAGEPR